MTIRKFIKDENLSGRFFFLFLFLFLVVIYRRYIAQCRLKSVGFTTSRKNNSLRVLRNLSVESQRDTSTCSAIGCHEVKDHEVTRSKNRLRHFSYFCRMQRVMRFPMIYSFPRSYRAIAEIKMFLIDRFKMTSKSCDPYFMIPVTLRPKFHWDITVGVGTVRRGDLQVTDNVPSDFDRAYYSVLLSDLDLQGDYDNVPSDFDRVYYSVLPYLSKVILNANDMNCTCQHQGCIVCDQQYLHSSIIHPTKSDGALS